MRDFDAVVIGGGILGCMTARNLRRWNISTVLMEAATDVCTGITRANSAIVYAGYDNKPGSRKASMTVAGNANMAALCQELEVPFSRCGSLLVTYDAGSVPKLERKLNNGIQNGVPGLRQIKGVRIFADHSDLARRDLIAAIAIDGLTLAETVAEYYKRGVVVCDRPKTSLYARRIVEALGVDGEGTIRVSPMHCHGREDIDKFLKATRVIAEKR